MTPQPGDTAITLIPACDDAGSGDPVVVLLHGWGFGHPSHLASLQEHLAPRHRVLKLDLPGHGRSDLPPQGFGFADCAAAVVALLDAAGVDHAVFCGHSLGARLAVEIAAAHPERAAGAILLDPVVLFPAPVRAQALQGLVPVLETDHWLPAVEGYFSRLLSPYDPPPVRSRVLAELADVVPGMAASVMRQGMESDGSDALSRLRCPLLVIRAQAPVNLEQLRELQPDAWVGAVVGSGHWMTLSVPDQVTAMVDRYLDVAVAAAAPRT